MRKKIIGMVVMMTFVSSLWSMLAAQQQNQIDAVELQKSQGT